VFLDEVQFCEGFESVLNGLSRRENLDIYVTGSNSKFLSSDILTEFRGRGDEVRVYPLSFSEFASAFPGDKMDAWREYMMYGGLPRILSSKTDEQKAKYLTDLFQNVYIKDVVERNHLHDDNILDDVVNVLASSIGSRNARLNFRQQEPTHIMENIIYNELVIRDNNVDVGVVEKYYKDEDGKQKVAQLEIDFVCNSGSNRYYIQSAYSLPDEEKTEQEMASFDRIDDSFKKIIVVADNMKPWHTEKGYLMINVIDFLMDMNSLEL
jgi:predicted AAA+ superfamily ATPase